MTPAICCFEPLKDFCCMNTPRVLMRSAMSMAFNFSAVPEKAPLAIYPMQSQTSDARAPRQVFSRMDLFPAY